MSSSSRTHSAINPRMPLKECKNRYSKRIPGGFAGEQGAMENISRIVSLVPRCTDISGSPAVQKILYRFLDPTILRWPRSASCCFDFNEATCYLKRYNCPQFFRVLQERTRRTGFRFRTLVQSLRYSDAMLSCCHVCSKYRNIQRWRSNRFEEKE